MNREEQIKELAKKQVIYPVLGKNAIRLTAGIRYGESEDASRIMDIYYPRDVNRRAPWPLVIQIFGYPFPAGWTQQWGPMVSWARLLAARGMAVMIYAGENPAADIHTLLQYLRVHAQPLDIDNNRIGLLATSGHVPNALSVMMDIRYGNIRCAALCYGYMLDINGSHSVAEAAGQYGFVNPCADKTIADIPGNLPLFIARAGQDQFPGVNAGIDTFASVALERNLPLTLVNHARGPHGFDLDDDSEACRYVIAQLLTFMSFHLCGDKGLTK